MRFVHTFNVNFSWRKPFILCLLFNHKLIPKFVLECNKNKHNLLKAQTLPSRFLRKCFCQNLSLSFPKKNTILLYSRNIFEIYHKFLHKLRFFLYILFQVTGKNCHRTFMGNLLENHRHIFASEISIAVKESVETHLAK